MELLLGLLAFIIIPIGLSIFGSNYKIVNVEKEKKLRDDMKKFSNEMSDLDKEIRKNDLIKKKRKKKKVKKIN